MDKWILGGNQGKVKCGNSIVKLGVSRGDDFLSTLDSGVEVRKINSQIYITSTIAVKQNEPSKLINQ